LLFNDFLLDLLIKVAPGLSNTKNLFVQLKNSQKLLQTVWVQTLNARKMLKKLPCHGPSSTT